MIYTVVRNGTEITFDTEKQTMEVYGTVTEITDLQVRDYGDGYIYPAETQADVVKNENKVISWKWKI